MVERRRRGVGCAVAVAVVAVVVAAAFLAWTGYTATPQYAALKMLQAVSDRDWSGFQRWVDVDSVVTLAVTAEVEKRAGSASAVPSGVVKAAVPAATQALRVRISSGVPGVPRDVPLAALVAGGVVRGASVTGEEADVTANAEVGGRVLRLDLRLRRQAGRWRVVEVRNAGDVLGRLL